MINFSENRTVRLLLAVWCLLPLFALLACVYIGLNDPFVESGEYDSYGLVYSDVISVSRRAFLVLGAVTITFALVLLFANRKSIFSRASLKNNPWFYLLGALLLWAVVSTLLSDDPLNQFRGSSYRCDGLFSYFIYAAILICALNVKDETHRKRLIMLFVAVVDVLCVCLLLEVLKVDPIYLIFQSPRAVVFNQFNHFGYVLCMANLCAAGIFLFGKSGKVKAFGILSFAFQVFSLLINDTFGCYLATLVGLAAMLIVWARSGRKINLRAFVPIIVFFALSVFNWMGGMAAISGGSVGRNFFQLFTDFGAIATDSPDAAKAGTGRMQLWMGALQMIPDRPIFGYGPEGLMGDYTAAYGVDRPHNEVIQYAVFLGIPALLMYLAALLTLAIRQWKSLKKLAPVTIVACVVVVGYFTSSLFGNTMFNTAPYYWMMLGFASFLPGQPSALFDASATSETLFQTRSEAVVLTIAFAVITALLITFGFML